MLIPPLPPPPHSDQPWGGSAPGGSHHSGSSPHQHGGGAPGSRGTSGTPRARDSSQPRGGSRGRDRQLGTDECEGFQDESQWARSVGQPSQTPGALPVPVTPSQYQAATSESRPGRNITPTPEEFQAQQRASRAHEGLAPLAITPPVPSEQPSEATTSDALVSSPVQPAIGASLGTGMDLDPTPGSRPRSPPLVGTSPVQKYARVDTAPIVEQERSATDFAPPAAPEASMASINFIRTTQSANPLLDSIWEIDGDAFRCSPVVHAPGSEEYLNKSSRDMLAARRVAMCHGHPFDLPETCRNLALALTRIREDKIH
jgi:hypothetical protein